MDTKDLMGWDGKRLKLSMVMASPFRKLTKITEMYT